MKHFILIVLGTANLFSMNNPEAFFAQNYLENYGDRAIALAMAIENGNEMAAAGLLSSTDSTKRPELLAMPIALHDSLAALIEKEADPKKKNSLEKDMRNSMIPSIEIDLAMNTPLTALNRAHLAANKWQAHLESSISKERVRYDGARLQAINTIIKRINSYGHSAPQSAPLSSIRERCFALYGNYSNALAVAISTVSYPAVRALLTEISPEERSRLLSIQVSIPAHSLPGRIQKYCITAPLKPIDQAAHIQALWQDEFTRQESTEKTDATTEALSAAENGYNAMERMKRFLAILEGSSRKRIIDCIASSQIKRTKTN